MPLVITHREKTLTYTNRIKVLHAEWHELMKDA